MPWYQADPASPTEPPSPWFDTAPEERPPSPWFGAAPEERPPSPWFDAESDQMEEWVASNFRVAPSTEGRSTNLTERELAALRYEELMARAGDVSWWERGPAHLGTSRDVSFWRGSLGGLE